MGVAVTGAPSYCGGMFRSASAGNISRRFRAQQRRVITASNRAPKKRKPAYKRDQVADLLSEGLEFDAIAERMGITLKAVTRHFDNIRARLGWQAR